MPTPRQRALGLVIEGEGNYREPQHRASWPSTFQSRDCAPTHPREICSARSLRSTCDCRFPRRRVGWGFRASRCIPDRRLNPAQCAGAALRRRRVAEIDQDLGVALRNGVGGNRSRPTTASPVARSNFQAFAARQEPKVCRPCAGERWIRTVGPRLSSATSFWPEFHLEFPNPATAFGPYLPRPLLCRCAGE